jgi:hypothetical protein
MIGATGAIYNPANRTVTMLQGAELLAQVKALGDRSRSELVRGCGYASPGKDGREHLHFTEFYEALLAAKGLSFQNGHHRAATRASREGRPLTFRSHVHFNGNLMVGKAYTNLLDLKPGDRFAIKLDGHGFKLVPC